MASPAAVESVFRWVKSRGCSYRRTPFSNALSKADSRRVSKSEGVESARDKFDRLKSLAEYEKVILSQIYKKLFVLSSN